MAHHHQQQQQDEEKQNPPFILDSLYCEEEHWEGEESYHNNNNISTHNNDPTRFPLQDQDLFLEDDEELNSLFSKEEQQFKLYFNNNTPSQNNPLLAASRHEAVDWIRNVVAHYSFSTLTALLAINYLDSFLFSFHFHTEKPWMIHLAAVTCLSLAAKFEETHVPLLLDLQVEETEYVFEAKTIQRMEILVLSNLQWKMNPVTPLSFIYYTIRRLGLKNHTCFEFLKRCEYLLISVIADCRSMCYLPSVIAAVTMLYVINSREAFIGLDYHSQILSILGIDKDKVEDCCKLIQELTSTGFGQCRSNKRKFGSLPGSPNRVMDLSLCSDSSNDSWGVASSVSSSPEPLSKKKKAGQEANAD